MDLFRVRCLNNKLINRLFTAIALGICCAGVAMADDGGFPTFYVSPSAFSSVPISKPRPKSDYGFQFALGIPIDNRWSVEGLSEIRNYSLKDGGRRSERGGSFQEIFKIFPDSSLTPTLAAGGGIVRSNYNGSHAVVPVARGGLGLLWSLPNSPISFRAEAELRREFGNTAVPKGTPQYANDVAMTLGFNYTIGDSDRPPARDAGVVRPVGYKPEAPAQSFDPQRNCTIDRSTNSCIGPPDADNDGVPDSRDKCPDTPPNAVVDADGCLLYLKPI